MFISVFSLSIFSSPKKLFVINLNRSSYKDIIFKCEHSTTCYRVIRGIFILFQYKILKRFINHSFWFNTYSNDISFLNFCYLFIIFIYKVDVFYFTFNLSCFFTICFWWFSETGFYFKSVFCWFIFWSLIFYISI